MQNLTQMLMQKWGRTAMRQATNRHALLLTTSAMMAMLLVGCDDIGDPVEEENHAPVVVHAVSELSMSYNDLNTYSIIIRATDSNNDSLSIVFTELDDFNLMHGEQPVQEDNLIVMDRDSENAFSVTLVHSEEDPVFPIENIINTMTFHVYDGEASSKSATYKLIIEAPDAGNEDINLSDPDAVLAAAFVELGLGESPIEDEIRVALNDAGVVLSVDIENFDGSSVVIQISYESDATGPTGFILVSGLGGVVGDVNSFTFDAYLSWNVDTGEITLDLIEEDDLYDAEAVFAAVVDGDSKEIFDAAINNNGESIGFLIENSDGMQGNIIVSRDHSMDVLSASYNDDKIAWYENDGSDNFTEHTISTSADGPISVYAADVDGDGDMDALSASPFDNKIAWYENNGSVGFSDKIIISDSAFGAYSVYAADVDGDGDMDVLSASHYDSKIAWYENDGRGGFSDKIIISDSAFGAASVYAADVDGDGDMDVLSASFSDDTIAWYENDVDDDGNVIFIEKIIISESAIGARSVVAADVDGDGDMDVLSASYNDDTIAWHENEGGGIFSAEEHDISTTAYGAASVYAADVDGDGDMDVLSASFSDDTIAWYVNDVGNDGNVIFIEKIIISEIAIGARSVVAADVDGDGDMDVLSASSYDDKIDWYENDGDESFTTHSISTLVDGAYSVYAFENDNNYILDVEILNAGGDPLGGYVDNVNWYDIA